MMILKCNHLQLQVVLSLNKGVYGGAAHVIRSAVTVSDSTFTHNVASNLGGAMCVEGVGSIAISSTTFDANTASKAVQLTVSNTLQLAYQHQCLQLIQVLMVVLSVYSVQLQSVIHYLTAIKRKHQVVL
jgi:hypothetical protein